MVSEKGYDYFAADMNWYGGYIERTLAEVIRARVEGVLISHIQEAFAEEHVAELRRAGIPVVSVNGESRPTVPLICDDVQAAFQELTRHLLDRKHRRIIQLVSSYSHLNQDRVRTMNHRTIGFRQAVESRGRWQSMWEEDFFNTPHRWERRGSQGITILQDNLLYDQVDRPVYKFCKRLFASGELPDAIVCSNDMYAIEAILAGMEHGIRVPEDLAITGYDNDRLGAFPAFSITTAEQDTERLCSTAVDLLMQQIADPNTEAKSHTFDSKIIIRNSSALKKRK